MIKRLMATAAALCMPLGMSAAAETAPARTGAIDTALGYLGCFTGTTTAHYFCVAAWEVDDGVRVVVLGEAGPGVVTEKYVEDVVVPSGVLARTSSGIELTATLQRTGHIDLASRTGRLNPAAGNQGCSSYALTYELVADGAASVIGTQTTDSGAIGGVAVSDLRCNAQITGPTTGMWNLAVLIDEGVLADPDTSTVL